MFDLKFECDQLAAAILEREPCSDDPDLWAIGELRKVGRNLIDRETGKTVRVVDVYVAEI